MDEEKIKILVVDDDSFVREMLASILESYDYDVDTAENGLEALKLADSSPDIDLIISDMNMPEMGGLELIEELRGAELEVPIIMLTGNDEISTAIEAMKIGANDYLLKDENIQETIPISAEKVLEKHQLKMQNIQLMKDLEQKNKELARMVFVDGLTGITNRRYFDNTSYTEWGRAAREGAPISIIMIDIDYFKFYNDTYGHQDGDDCLKEVARALDDALERSGDFVSRYGGEEFVAVLPNTDLAGAMVVAENMKANVSDLKLKHESSKVSDHVTISLGVGSISPSRRSEPSDLILEVDKALYKAKQNGRNRIEIIEEEA